MKFTLLTLLPLAAAIPMEKRSQGSFGVMSARSGSAIHLLPMNANSGGFYLGGSTSSYCPETVGSACPSGKETVFAGPTALDVTVPGGQQVYVDAKGALTFTVPHSGYIPEGSSTGPFKYTPGTDANPIGSYVYTGQGATGFMACPVTSGEEKKWQVFAALSNATVPSGNVNDCLGFDAMATASTSNSTAAWEYI